MFCLGIYIFNVRLLTPCASCRSHVRLQNKEPLKEIEPEFEIRKLTNADAMQCKQAQKSIRNIGEREKGRQQAIEE